MEMPREDGGVFHAVVFLWVSRRKVWPDGLPWCIMYTHLSTFVNELTNRPRLADPRVGLACQVQS